MVMDCQQRRRAQNIILKPASENEIEDDADLYTGVYMHMCNICYHADNRCCTTGKAGVKNIYINFDQFVQ